MKKNQTKKYLLFLICALNITTPLICKRKKAITKKERTTQKAHAKKIQKKQNQAKATENDQSWWQPVARMFEKQEIEIITKEFRTQAKHISIENLNGNVSVRTWPYEKVVIELHKKGHKADLENTEIKIDVTPQKVHIGSKIENKDTATAIVNYSIIVPEKAEVIASTNQGSISIYDVHGPVKATTLSGSIELKQCQDLINAQAPQGSINVHLNKLYPKSSIFLQAYSGIKLGIPAKCNAALTAHNTQGVILSNMYVTLNPITTKLDKTFWHSVKHRINGTIGAGSSPNAVPIILENYKKPIEIRAL